MISFERLDFKCFIHTAGIQRAEISISFSTTGDSNALVKHRGVITTKATKAAALVDF
jgi:hypothetical protein